jgi:hypothetical protein
VIFGFPFRGNKIEKMKTSNKTRRIFFMNMKKTVAGIMAGAMAISAMATIASAEATVQVAGPGADNNLVKVPNNNDKVVLTYDLRTYVQHYTDTTLTLTRTYNTSSVYGTTTRNAYTINPNYIFSDNADFCNNNGANKSKNWVTLGSTYNGANADKHYDLAKIDITATSLKKLDNTGKETGNSVTKTYTYYDKDIFGTDLGDQLNTYQIDKYADSMKKLADPNDGNSTYGVEVAFATLEQAVRLNLTGAFIVDPFEEMSKIASIEAQGAARALFNTKADAEAFLRAYQGADIAKYQVYEETDGTAQGGQYDPAKVRVIYKDAADVMYSLDKATLTFKAIPINNTTDRDNDGKISVAEAYAYADVVDCLSDTTSATGDEVIVNANNVVISNGTTSTVIGQGQYRVDSNYHWVAQQNPVIVYSIATTESVSNYQTWELAQTNAAAAAAAGIANAGVLTGKPEIAYLGWYDADLAKKNITNDLYNKRLLARNGRYVLPCALYGTEDIYGGNGIYSFENFTVTSVYKIHITKDGDGNWNYAKDKFDDRLAGITGKGISCCLDSYLCNFL